MSTRPGVRQPPFGAILAGGENRRYGAHKALAAVGGRPILERVEAALRAVLPDLVLIANDAQVYGGAGLPMRPDALPGMGSLGGIYTALLWAREAGRPGVLAVACDMPFLSPALLARLLEAAASGAAAATAGGNAGTGPDVVAPGSESRRGVEPLCAYYGTGCIAAIEAELARGERHIVGFFPEVRVRTLPLEEVRAYGDPAALFLNVNTAEERERAEALARGGEHG